LCSGRCQRRNIEKQENHRGETHKRRSTLTMIMVHAVNDCTLILL
jgi:hypothetical protein